MSRRTRLPKYRLDKTTGHPLFEIDGVTHCLGKHGTPESRAKYDHLIAGRLAGGRATTTPVPADLRIVEPIDLLWTHVGAHCHRPDGRPTSEVGNFRDALRPLKAL